MTFETCLRIPGLGRCSYNNTWSRIWMFDHLTLEVAGEDTIHRVFKENISFKFVSLNTDFLIVHKRGNLLSVLDLFFFVICYRVIAITCVKFIGFL